MAEKVKRRLTSILCADAKSYARLMESNEAGTIDTLRRYKSAMDALVARHEGRTINTWGDAIIAEFASVVEAVQCAVEIQRELAARNHELPETQKMWFRIGINLGDVMVENGDLYGEGVNIAARLQEMADPGGIMISGPVYDMVRNKLAISFEHLGQQAVKNVSEPVSSYRVLLEGNRPAGQESATVAMSPSRPGGGMLRAAWHWFEGLPSPVKSICAVILFLFVIDLFDGLDSIWFHWPAAVGLLAIFLHLSFRRRKTRR